MSTRRIVLLTTYSFVLAMLLGSCDDDGKPSKAIEESLMGRDANGTVRCEPGYMFMRLGPGGDTSRNAELCIPYKLPKN